MWIPPKSYFFKITSVGLEENFSLPLPQVCGYKQLCSDCFGLSWEVTIPQLTCTMATPNHPCKGHSLSLTWLAFLCSQDTQKMFVLFQVTEGVFGDKAGRNLPGFSYRTDSLATWTFGLVHEPSKFTFFMLLVISSWCLRAVEHNVEQQCFLLNFITEGWDTNWVLMLLL